ncbi:MAG TPA: maleylpyruvate isomerase family mycothiol-dependent enzyme [Nocardioides sp.]|nr:maleylpyruvate isomerase family mycothiol-dependent enzyme [Nocardioides sp.]
MISTVDWIAELTGLTGSFAAELEHGDLDAPVPTCPAWTLADLGDHVRWVHRWAAHAVTDGDPKGSTDAVGPAEVVAAYRAAAGDLVAVLDTDPAAPAWTFGPDQVVGFWQRRQVHETLIHLYDALLATGRAGLWQPRPELAWDGVDEVATMFYPRQVRLGRTQPLTHRLVLTATDVDRTAELGAGDPVELTGTAADLLLTLWKRIQPADPAIAAALTAAITP